MGFDMNRTWSQAIALVQANFQLLAIIAGVFLLLPNVLFYVVLPDFTAMLGMSQDPEVMSAMLGDMAGRLIAFGLVAMLCQLIGYMAMVALMGDSRPTVGEALRNAFSNLPTMIGVTILLILVYIAVGLVLSLATGLLAAALGALLGEAAALLLSFLVLFVLLFAMLYVAARFTLTVPSVVLGGMRNPVAVLGNSYKLTSPFAKRIFLFYLLLIVCYLVLSIIIGAVMGLLAAMLGSGPGSALFIGLVNGVMAAAVAMIFSGILVSMYEQIAGHGEEIRETFE